MKGLHDQDAPDAKNAFGSEVCGPGGCSGWGAFGMKPEQGVGRAGETGRRESDAGWGWRAVKTCQKQHVELDMLFLTCCLVRVSSGARCGAAGMVWLCALAALVERRRLWLLWDVGLDGACRCGDGFGGDVVNQGTSATGGALTRSGRAAGGIAGGFASVPSGRWAARRRLRSLWRRLP